VPPIQQRRPDVPNSFVAVLDTALNADPTQRFSTAEEFAQALGQVMKGAVGINPTVALGQAVVESRRQLGTAGDSMNAMPTHSEIEYSKADEDLSNVETIPLQKKKPPPPR
jgi:hypothetical protein